MGIKSLYNCVDVANGDTMTKNNNQSLKIKDGHEVTEKENIGWDAMSRDKNTWDVKSIDQFYPWDILTREAHSPGLK